MEGVDVRDQERRKHEEQQQVTQAEVRREVSQLSDLTQELTARLREAHPSHAVPFTGPPSNVGRVGSELTSEGQSNDKLVDETLDRERGDHADKHLGEAPSLKEEHDLPHDDKDNNGDGVSDSGQDSTEFFAAHAENGSHTASHHKEDSRNTSIDTNRSECNDSDTNEGVGPLQVGVRCVRVDGTSRSSSRVDVKVRNESHSNEEKGTDNLSEEDVTEAGTRRISRQFGGRLTKHLLLKSGDAGTRKTDESNPGCRVSLGVSTGQPSEELTVVDEEVGPCELVRVEQERSNTESEKGNPEVKKPVSPNGQSTKQKHEKQTDTQVDRRSSETRVENTEGHTGSGETTTGTDVTGTTV